MFFTEETGNIRLDKKSLNLNLNAIKAGEQPSLAMNENESLQSMPNQPLVKISTDKLLRG